MPNGHGGIPKYGSPILLLALTCLLLYLQEYSSAATYLKFPSAVFLAWRFSWHLCLYNVREYGGHYTSEAELKKAERNYHTALSITVPLGLLIVFLL